MVMCNIVQCYAAASAWESNSRLSPSRTQGRSHWSQSSVSTMCEQLHLRLSISTSRVRPWSHNDLQEKIVSLF